MSRYRFDMVYLFFLGYAVLDSTRLSSAVTDLIAGFLLTAREIRPCSSRINRRGFCHLHRSSEHSFTLCTTHDHTLQRLLVTVTRRVGMRGLESSF